MAETEEPLVQAAEEEQQFCIKRQELRLMTEGVSNAEYHYLGSAKILGRIGEAFAEAVHKL